MKYRKFFATTVAILATAAAAGAAEVSIDIRQIIREEIARALAAEAPTAAPIPIVSSDRGVTNPLTGPAQFEYEEVTADGYSAYTKQEGSAAEDAVKFEVRGDAVVVTEPSRGLSVNEAQLQAKYFIRLAEQGGKVVEERIPLMLPGSRYQFNWVVRSGHDLFTLAKLSGLSIVMFGVNNPEEAIIGKRDDGPVRSTKVFMVESIDDRYNLAGNLMLFATRERKVISEKHYDDFNGIFYWAQLRAPVDVVVESRYPIHHKSAKLRPAGYVVPAGELFTVFFGGKESVLGKDNGRELCVPIHPARVLRK